MKSIILTIAAARVSVSGLFVLVVATNKRAFPAQTLGIFMMIIGVALGMLYIYG